MSTSLRRGLRAAIIAILAAVLVLVGAGTGRAGSVASAMDAHLSRAPYLTDLVGLGVAVNFATDRSATNATVTYGPVTTSGCTLSATLVPSRRSITVGTVGEYQWTAHLSLPTAGTYCYRVFLAGTDLLAGSPSPTFVTQQQPGDTSPFSFDVMGDWGMVNAAGTNPDAANLMSQVAASGARFMVTVGDNGYPSGNQLNYGDLQQTGASTSAIFGSQFWTVPSPTTPIFTAAGNHGLSGTSHTDITTWTQDAAVAGSNGRYQDDVYCCVNGTISAHYASEWYAFTAGGARFYVLDAAWGDTNKGTATPYANDAAAHWAPGDPEYQWLLADLASHPSQLKFAFFHYPLYVDNPTESSDTFLSGPNNLEGVLGSHGVQIVFNGHAHLYQRNLPSAPGMPISYVTGGGGGSLEPVGPCSTIDAYARGWSPSKSTGSACGAATRPVAGSQVYHFLKVTVSGTQVTVAPTDSLGRTFDVQTYQFPLAAGQPTAGPVFADDFEAGNMGAWSSSAGLSVESDWVHGGSHAARGNTTNGATYAKKTLLSQYADGYGQVWFAIASQQAQVNLLRLRDASGASLAYAYVTAAGHLGIHNDRTGSSVTSSVTVTPGWHALEVHRAVDTTPGTATGRLEVWLDGVPVASLSSAAADVGTAPIAALQIGDTQTGRTYDVAFDDAAFAPSWMSPDVVASSNAVASVR
ncbi:MAG TPA: metallophosphoesterase [Flexivirga sp.]|uniref:metallophosphoesterase family protein n=1 Tax=Flexivirga sp. TaxID=1962927 RepID=UPI002C466140|nr:metallophosphoesterase [Flexivirga sp.]HWC24012.1 metallophosphoesterase [Flexivirga sp.]